MYNQNRYLLKHCKCMKTLLEENNYFLNKKEKKGERNISP